MSPVYEDSKKDLVHILLVSFTGQGHVNPLLRLGNLLASTGLLVTFSSSSHVGNSMRKANKNIDQLNPVGHGMIRFEFFDDGLLDNDPRRHDLDLYMPQLELLGKEAVTGIIKKHEKEGRPVSCLINNPFIPWVSDIAHTLNIRNAVLWVQSCACFSAYYHYHNKLAQFPTESDPEIDVQLPYMPLLKNDEIPSFLHPSSPYPALRRAILGQFRNLSKPFCVLVETFHELESEVIDYMSKFCPVKAIGPLFNNPKSQLSTIQGDCLKPDDDCIDFLNSKTPLSVVYISFGSIISMNQEQTNELAAGLLNSGVSFLWVFRPALPGFDVSVLPEKFLEAAGDRGKVVQWCSQKQVLANPAVACFLTHCGWNSTLEALTTGVPVITYPAWGDQVTNAKFLVDVLKVGVRLSRGDQSKKDVISRTHIEKCLREATTGEDAAGIKKNALKWKKAAEDAVAEGGSSDRNFKAFVDELRMN
ncbi:gallate 1-beta-glucosyltransferase 84A24-like [Apium graveolens]|uniref:gallate 1-beta-glucosyltransferase 84A24-like n=1 Tax=Apium graveolens TaxID=4045 RepID=UPI003D79AA97